MDDDSDNTLIGWILGIAVTLSVTIALLAGVVGINAGPEAPAAPAAAAPAVAPAAAPVAAPAPAVAAAAPIVAKVYFDSGVTALPADGAAALQPVVDAARARADARIAISGYHDKTGNPEQNAELAKKRAFAVRDALVAAGIAEPRIELRKPEEAQGDGNDREARRVEATVE
ncbi:MAG: OmpA family protein [Burkholderiales bacterium]|nr:MAG: OmpA family protein [Burkholderiales bacterium]